MSRWKRARSLALRGAKWLGGAFVAFVVFTVLEVVAVRFVDPPVTITMLERSLEATRAGTSPRWPAHTSPPMSDLGPVPRAFVASEDARFYFHHGFDTTAICAALRSNAKGKPLRGGSTLTQQVAKNVFLWQGRSWPRKVLEAWYTALLELLVPKNRILELYLGVAETGPMVFGAEAGARHHFGKPAAKLTPEEAGRLAGLLPDPRRRSVSGEAAWERAAFVAQFPAPFPGDRSFDLVKKTWDVEPGLRACWE